jgi:hypothetical protein
MIRKNLSFTTLFCLPFCALVLALPAAAVPDDGNGDSSVTKPAEKKSADEEIAALKTALANQQKQIDELRRALDAQQKTQERQGVDNSNKYAESTLGHQKSLGEVASTTPIIPGGGGRSSSLGSPVASPPPVGQTPAADTSAPMQLKLGNAYIMPVGFMDMTSVTRSTNPGTGIGTNFGSIPYRNTQAGSLTESRLSPQNSRLGLRFDTGFKGFDVLGYWESDFLGQTGAPPNGGLAVSSNPYVFRLRLFWVDVRKDKFEFLAGQSWSLMTPNRKGISPLPGDIFFSQDIDVNYQAGLVWGRIPGFRAAYHFNDKATFALALENSEPYVGGGNGGSAITGPAAIYGTPNAVSGAVLGGQINNGNSVISAAALHPDIIAKLAFDPTPKFHIELAAVEITNKIANPVSTPTPFQTSTKAGGGGSVNLNFELFKNFRIFTNNYWSAGGGRYIFGQAPDFMIRANGDLSLVRSGSTVSGFEATAGKTLIYSYYGGVYVAKNLALDANGKSLIGYGGIASDGQNRAIQEFTFGTNTTLARDPKWGGLNLMFQYSYLQRNPWFAALGAPSNAHLSMGFVNLRYTLPGSPGPKASAAK